ncbi:hypothetical protein MKX01_007259 [Papaver californicum]|nr:hypothetical protein MKX01_007259 [Papaver californicum]
MYQETSTPGAPTSSMSTSQVDRANERGSTTDQLSLPHHIQATQLPLHRSLRFIQQPQHREPVHTQNAIAKNDNLASNLNLHRSPRLMDQAQYQESRHTENEQIHKEFKSEEGEVVHVEDEVLQEGPHS